MSTQTTIENQDGTVIAKFDNLYGISGSEQAASWLRVNQYRVDDHGTWISRFDPSDQAYIVRKAES